MLPPLPLSANLEGSCKCRQRFQQRAISCSGVLTCHRDLCWKTHSPETRPLPSADLKGSRDRYVIFMFSNELGSLSREGSE
ncbi:hypothetical protein NDU88_004454 [Pleurodeles waltl]|uniref:Uncharacterized protein n=1 Tax=Pleurodeles waltl TaxID=8319 RepID=A0AAV7M772_PLEWA|nr:hypothetical protein NDU88_004454 [Pleurodeles waltl]